MSATKYASRAELESINISEPGKKASQLLEILAQRGQSTQYSMEPTVWRSSFYRIITPLTNRGYVRLVKTEEKPRKKKYYKITVKGLLVLCALDKDIYRKINWDNLLKEWRLEQLPPFLAIAFIKLWVRFAKKWSKYGGIPYYKIEDDRTAFICNMNMALSDIVAECSVLSPFVFPTTFPQTFFATGFFLDIIRSDMEKYGELGHQEAEHVAKYMFKNRFWRADEELILFFDKYVTQKSSMEGFVPYHPHYLYIELDINKEKLLSLLKKKKQSLKKLPPTFVKKAKVIGCIKLSKIDGKMSIAFEENIKELTQR